MSDKEKKVVDAEAKSKKPEKKKEKKTGKIKEAWRGFNSERKKIVASIRYVDEVFFEESLELKREYILKFKADILIMGNDWEGRFDEFKDICEVIYLPRTPSISATELIEVIKR